MSVEPYPREWTSLEDPTTKVVIHRLKGPWTVEIHEAGIYPANGREFTDFQAAYTAAEIERQKIGGDWMMARY